MLYLEQQPLREEGIVIGVGPKSFTVLIVRLGISERVYVNQLKGVEGTYHTATSELTLVKSQPIVSVVMNGVPVMNFEVFQIVFMKRFQVLLTAIEDKSKHPGFIVSIL